MTKLTEGKVIGVFRKCRTCGVWKPLAHYMTYRNTPTQKVCAACRATASNPHGHRPV